jgi:hypothetical protein
MFRQILSVWLSLVPPMRSRLMRARCPPSGFVRVGLVTWNEQYQSSELHYFRVDRKARLPHLSASTTPRAPDSNIDHRRVPNLMVFFQRKGQSLPVSHQTDDYSPGDLVTWEGMSGTLELWRTREARKPGDTCLFITWPGSEDGRCSVQLESLWLSGSPIR